jgi:uncharacterized protein YbjT (DUF2867 family)
VEAGHDVVAMTRRPDSYPGAGTPVRADVHDAESLDAALAGADAAYYLVHSLDDADFLRKDAEAARTFAQAAGRAGLRRIVYLGGLGDDADALSATCAAAGGGAAAGQRRGPGHDAAGRDHRRPRRHLLGDDPPARRAPAGHAHAALGPHPHAADRVADVVRYLVGVLEAPVEGSRSFDIGGPEVLQYVEMMRRVAVIEGRKLLIVPVPLLTPRLSSRWLSLVTSVDVQTGRSLIDSMSNEVVVRDDSIRELVPFDPLDYDDAVLQALGERAKAARA